MKNLKQFKAIADVNLDKLDMPEKLKIKLKKEAECKKKFNFRKLGIIGIPAAAAVIIFAILFTGTFSVDKSIHVYADNLMKNITPHKVKDVKLTDKFIESTADFSVDLFKHSYTKNKNSMISPSSVCFALGMAANGSSGETLNEFQNLLGKKGININDLNSYYNSLTDKLTDIEDGKLSIVNSIWYNSADKNLNVKNNFLQTNADYYNASAYGADFSKPDTVSDINNWVKSKTENTIDKVIDKTNSKDIMYLINAVYFDQQWKEPYKIENVRKGSFELMDGTTKSVDFMYSTERGYIKDDKAQGFIKPYKNGKYSFVALLPNKDINIYDYVSSLTGEKFLKLISNKSDENVNASLPKFNSEYEIRLKEPLKQMGLKKCFSGKEADFSKMVYNNSGNIYVGNIIHKTFITVSEHGTKAAAITSGVVDTMAQPPSISIYLNRPFVYAIIDNETKLPLFMGIMINPLL